MQERGKYILITCLTNWRQIKQNTAIYENKEYQRLVFTSNINLLFYLFFSQPVVFIEYAAHISKEEKQNSKDN
jgi:hypothetical protein